jgi:hypothetical protein
MVTKRIKDVIAKIRRTNPELARHFASRIRTGYTCSYVIVDDNPQNWSVSDAVIKSTNNRPINPW